MKIIASIFSFIGRILHGLRWLLLGLLALGLPLYLYVAFVAKEPVFAPENDVALGQQTVLSIEEDPEQYPLLSESEYPEVYAHLRDLVGRLVNSPEIRYRDIFSYDQVKIIHDDEVLNAFCAPGGYIYVYSGLMRYLDTEDHLAGVLGHEIAHAELRHSSLRLQKEYGTQKLLDFALLATPVSLGQAVNASILQELVNLDYSRDQEAQADEYSVRYLADSGYACDGAAGFFAKLLEQGKDGGGPALLSDHPDSESRVRAIRKAAAEAGCNTTLQDASSWRAVQAQLPPQQGG